MVDVYQQQLAALEIAMRQLIHQDPILNARVQRLIQVKGLGLLSVSVMIAETNGFEGFPNQRNLVSYAGYDVVENHGAARAVRYSVRQNPHLKEGQSSNSARPASSCF